MATINAAQKYFPQIDKSVQPEVTVHLQRIYTAINDHDQAIVTLSGKTPGSSSNPNPTAGATSNNFATTIVQGGGVTTFNSQTGPVSYFPNLGIVNNQGGVTSYITQTSDNGGLIILNSASPIAVTLNFGVTVPWYTTISNEGTGTATITPSSGTINGLASITLPGGSWVTIYFDGANWWADAPGSNVGGVTQLIAGTNITLSPTSGTGVVTINASGGTSGVTQIVAGTNITLSPAGGTGVVTINASGGTSGVTQIVAGTNITLSPAGGTGVVTISATGGGGGTADHFLASGAPATIAVQSGAGIGGSAVIDGRDAAGTFEITTGTGVIAGLLAIIHFAVDYASAPIVVLTAANSAAALVNQLDVTSGIDGFGVNMPSTMSALENYAWNYIVIGLA